MFNFLLYQFNQFNQSAQTLKQLTKCKKKIYVVYYEYSRGWVVEVYLWNPLTSIYHTILLNKKTDCMHLNIHIQKL